MKPKPLIGITTGEIYNLNDPWNPFAYGQSYTYCDAVIRAGGVPVLIPITSNEEVLRALYGVIQGLLLAGGNDIAPELYGEDALSVQSDVSPSRDAAELKLLAWALEDKMPLFGVCRGAQLWNAYKGGSLYQDIATQLPEASDHELSTKRKDLVHIAHMLKVENGSQFAQLIDSETIGANTHHHQAFKKLGEGIKPCAWAEDGVIEAIESTDLNQFGIGVQCHPESLLDKEPKWNKVFHAFVEASGR